jgi:AcrR family transcriptional regulator
MATPPSPSPPAAERPPPGLRERKKARTRASIQSHALALIRGQGYEATTVAQIADAAEVSESTFFRYFPTKADVVLADEFDPVIAAAFRRQPPSVGAVGAMRAAFREAFAGLTPEQQAEQAERSRLALTVPELRAAMIDQFADAFGTVTGLVAERTGRAADDPELSAFAGAVLGVAIAATEAMIADPSAGFISTLDAAFGHLEDGFSGLRASGAGAGAR